MKSKNKSTLETKGGPDPDTNVSEIKSRLDEMTEQLAEVQSVKSANTEAIAELKAAIDATKETVADLPANYGPKLKALQDEVAKLATGAALLDGKSANAPEGIKAITKAIADSDVYKSIFDPKTGQKTQQIVANGQWSAPTRIESYASAAYKAPSPVVISDMAGGDYTVHKPGIVMQRQWDMDIMSRIPSVITRNATTYTVPYETDPSRYGAWKTTLAANIDGDPTPKSTATLTDTEGCLPGSTHRFYNASDVLLGTAVVVSFDSGTDVVTYVTNSLDFDATAGWKVTSENYSAIAELAEKPSGFVGTANRSFTLKTLPSIIPTTVNALNTVQGLQTLIERKMPMRDRRNMSYHLLYGDDTANQQLQGLRTYTGAQSYNWSDGVSGDNQVDAIMRAVNLIPWGAPIAVIMSQADLPALTLLKGGDGHYLRTGQFGMMPLSQIGMSWFLGAHELVFDYAVTSGDFTPINFSAASEIADQDTASLMWGYINDDFVKNIIRARYEATRAHAILDVQEYVVGEWDAAP